MPRLRDFYPAAADKLEDERLRVPWTEQTGLKGKVRSFTVFLPRLLIKEDGKEEPACTNLDEELLRDMLVRHYTLTVLTSLWRGTWRYFRASPQRIGRVQR